MKVFLGVDHGLKGALAVINEHGGVMRTLKMPLKKVNGEESIDAFAIFSWLHLHFDEYEFDTLATGERLHAIFKAAASTTFSFGKNVGVVTGIIEAFEMDYQEVRAVEWQKYIFTTYEIPETHETKKTPSGKLKKDTKIMAAIAVEKIFGDNYRGLSDGINDALLIAKYAQLTHKGE